MTDRIEMELNEIARAYARRIGAKLLYVNADCGKFGVELKSGDFKNIYFSDLERLLEGN